MVLSVSGPEARSKWKVSDFPHAAGLKTIQVHLADAIADQSQSGKTGPGCHFTHLSVLSFL